MANPFKRDIDRIKKSLGMIPSSQPKGDMYQKIPGHYFHATLKENTSIIRTRGLQPGSLCPKIDEILREFNQSGRSMTKSMERELAEARARCESGVVWVADNYDIAVKNAYAGKEMETSLRESLGLSVDLGLSSIINSEDNTAARRYYYRHPAIVVIFKLSDAEISQLLKEPEDEEIADYFCYGEITLSHVPASKLVRIEDIPAVTLFTEMGF